MRPALLALAAAAGLAAAGPLPAQPVAPPRPDQVALAGDLADVRALATDERTLWVLAADGVVPLDPWGDRWLPPVAMAGGYTPEDPPVAAAWDPLEDGVWVATRSGALHLLHPATGRWETRGRAPGPVRALAADRGGDLWLRGDAGWHRLPPGALFPEPVPAPPPGVLAAARTLDERAAADPYLAADLPRLGLGEGARRWPLTAAVATGFGDELWVASAGGGVRRWTPGGSGAWRTAGVPGGGAGALAVGPADGASPLVWIGGRPRPPARGGAAAVTPALDRWWTWRAEEGGPEGAALAALATADALWLGTADGLHRLPLENGLPPAAARWERFGERHGLPDAAVGALAPAAGGGLWVGTRRGLVRTDAGARPVAGPYLPGRAVHALAAAHDTLWAATDAGLAAVTAAGMAGVDPTLPPGAITAVAALGERLFAVQQGRILERTAAGWAPAAAGAGAAGGVLVLRATGGTVWAGGEGGVLCYAAGAAAWRPYPLPPELPAGPVLDVLEVDGQLWLATPRGALRLPAS